MNRARTVVAALTLAAVSIGAASWSAERTSSPPHVERPTAGASAPLPLAAVGGESDRAATAPIEAWIEGVARAQWYEGVAAAEEAERLEAAQRSANQPRAAAGTGQGEPVFAAGDDVWAALRQCEAGGNYAANTGNGFYGAYQFLPSTWRAAVSGAGHGEWADVLPSEAPPHVQDAAAQHLQSVSGWGPWPGCTAKLGLR